MSRRTGLNIWRAGGIENDERGAWRSLVRAHGSGRAGWLADNFQPTNLATAPPKAEATDEILVIPTITPLYAAGSRRRSPRIGRRCGWPMAMRRSCKRRALRSMERSVRRARPTSSRRLRPVQSVGQARASADEGRRRAVDGIRDLPARP